MLDVVNIHKAFLPGTANEKVALSGVTLHLAAGDFCTVIGSNGAGKSTLLNVVSGRYRPDGGTVRIDGRRVDRLPDHTVARYVARVFQDPMAGTAAHMTIEENLSLAMGRGTARGLGQGVTRAKREFLRTQLKVLEQGLEDRLTTKVGLLSGGQRQALSLVMATFGDPKVLLLDEHTAALDPQRAELITNLTRELVAEKGLTTLMVTHNMEQALRLGNRLIMMHEGRIIFELSGQDKAGAGVEDLMAEFDRIKGAQLSDRTLLT